MSALHLSLMDEEQKMYENKKIKQLMKNLKPKIPKTITDVTDMLKLPKANTTSNLIIPNMNYFKEKIIPKTITDVNDELKLPKEKTTSKLIISYCQQY